MPARLHAPVPIGERHHDVQGGEHQAEVEEGVAVGDAVLLIVKGLACHLVLLRALQDGRALLCPHQTVHLPVVRGAHTAGEGGGRQVGRWAVPGGLMHHGTGHNNGHDGPRALRAGDLVLRSWGQELTNCFDSQPYSHPLYELGQGTPLGASDSLSIKSGTAVPPLQGGWED